MILSEIKFERYDNQNIVNSSKFMRKKNNYRSSIDTLAIVRPIVPVPQQMSRTVVVLLTPHHSAICSYKTSAPGVLTIKKNEKMFNITSLFRQSEFNILELIYFLHDKNLGKKHLGIFQNSCPEGFPLYSTSETRNKKASLSTN